MSKFVKVSDVKQTLLEMSKEKTRPVGWGDVLMERLKDLSIEVSEDAISREGLSDKVGRYYAERGDFGSFECSWILNAIKIAPSVVPSRGNDKESEGNK